MILQYIFQQISYFIFSFCHLQLFGSVLWVPGWWGQHHVRNSRKIDQVQVNIFLKYFLLWKRIYFEKQNLNLFAAVCMEPAVYLATLTTLDFCDSASKPHYSFVLSNRPCPLLSSSSNPMVTTRKANGTQTR